jgi:Glucokinase
MFVTGGLTPKNINFIENEDSEFMKAYHDKGRVSPLLSHIPLFAVMVEDLGIRGAHRCCLEEYENLTREDVAPVLVDATLTVPVAAPFYGPWFLVMSTIVSVAAGFLLSRSK